MEAICRLYGVKYGEGARYKTLDEAYASITGYDLGAARALMKKAADELSSGGVYKKGEEVRVRVAFSAGALSSDDNKLISLLNKYLNAAAENSGFGTITLEAVGNVENRYSAVPSGEYAVGYGAWGGAAFYPFRHFELYMDPDKYSVNEAACYDPKKDVLTLSVGGENVSMTWQEWSRSMLGSGRYAAALVSKKLEVCARLEEAFLSTYYRIPLYSSTESTLLSHQCDYYTDEYNIMYGFGGLRLLSYRYNDGEWASAVRDGVDYK
jgi:oligopeptide transport system substrate-binding protein